MFRRDLSENELSGRTALVTGGSGDIGSAIVRALARRGANIIIHYNRGRDRAVGLCNEVSQSHQVNCIAMKCDLSEEDEIKTFLQDLSTYGTIDILINNAGTPIRRVHWMALDSGFIESVFALNFRAPFYLIQHLSKDMIDKHSGVIINILTTAAQTGGTDTVLAYAAAKGALLTLTRGLARALAASGVRVLAVSPGTINTRIQQELTSPELMSLLISNIPLGRIGRPEEIGEVVAFLATDQAGFIVGETVEVNGGAFMY